jgi:hypothetical protein
MKKGDSWKEEDMMVNWQVKKKGEDAKDRTTLSFQMYNHLRSNNPLQ